MRSGDKTIEWDSEVLANEPGKRIAWRSIGSDFDNAGEVIFETAPAGRGTMVTVLQEFRMSKLASAWETMCGGQGPRNKTDNTGEAETVHGHRLPVAFLAKRLLLMPLQLWN
jgi:hypothetical protein